MAANAKDKTAPSRPVGPADPEVPGDDEEVDLDLGAVEAVDREEELKPTTIRLRDGKVITIPHMDGWEYDHSRMMSQGDFTGWAAGVLNEDDFRSWMEAHLLNREITSIVAKVMANAALSLGKSARSSRSSRPRRGR